MCMCMYTYTYMYTYMYMYITWAITICIYNLSLSPDLTQFLEGTVSPSAPGHLLHYLLRCSSIWAQGASTGHRVLWLSFTWTRALPSEPSYNLNYLSAWILTLGKGYWNEALLFLDLYWLYIHIYIHTTCYLIWEV